MEANNHVNSVIIEYVEGIEVVKAFNQSTSSYEKFVGAVESFKGFTLDWFRSTWKTMNLMLAIMPDDARWRAPCRTFAESCRSDHAGRIGDGDHSFSEHCWTIDEGHDIYQRSQIHGICCRCGW